MAASITRDAPLQMAPAVEDLEITLLLEGVFQCFGYDFRGYRREPVRQKLYGLMQAWGIKTVSALQDRVMHELGAGEALIRALGVQPVTLFDNPAYFLALRSVLIPWLRSCAAPKIWIAECACAEEVCALAILLAEEDVYDKTQIFATAAHEALLHEASRGQFASERVAQYEQNYLRSGGTVSLDHYYNRHNGEYRFSRQLLENITWAQYSLVTDASFNEFQLIACRKAMNDFGPLLRHRTLQLFYDSLPLFGMLSIGENTQFNAAPNVAPNVAPNIAPFINRYQTICPQQGLYRRIA